MFLSVSSISAINSAHYKKPRVNKVINYTQMNPISFKSRLISTRYFIEPHSDEEANQRNMQFAKDLTEKERRMTDKKTELQAQKAQIEIANKRALNRIEHTGSINEIHNKLKTEFCSKLTVEKTDSGIKIPHGIMLEGAWGKFADDLIKWTADNSDCHFVQVSGKDNDTLQENLWEELNKAKKIFKRTKERTLISVESFDRLITKGLNSFENIEALKAEMCRFATEYGATIIFGTKDAKKLVSEAIQPNRLVRVITRIV